MDYVRIIPCLDVKDGRVVKGIHFVNLRDAGDPVECAAAYSSEGADEVAFLDITATVEHRKTMVDVVKKTARVVKVPFTVGGGIACSEDVDRLLEAGASKVSISTAAFRDPEFLQEAAERFGSQRIIVAIDADANEKMPSGYEVYVDGGRTATKKDAVAWARETVGLGAGEVLLTSKATDGTRSGYDLRLTRLVAESVKVPVTASGGAGELEHFYEGATEGKARGLLAASVFHFGILSIRQVKEYLAAKKIPVRL